MADFQKFRRGLEHWEFAVQLVMWGRGTSIQFSTGRLGGQIPSVLVCTIIYRAVGTSYQSAEDQYVYNCVLRQFFRSTAVLQYLNLGTVVATCTSRESFTAVVHVIIIARITAIAACFEFGPAAAYRFNLNKNSQFARSFRPEKRSSGTIIFF